MNNNENIRKIVINKNDIVLVKKNLISSLSDTNIFHDKIILPKEKLSSPYNYNNISLLDILDISDIKSNNLIVNKNKFTIKNRSLSCDSLLNFYIIEETMYRNIYNKYLAFHNIIHK